VIVYSVFCLDEFVEEPEDEYDLIVSTLHFIPKITKRITSSDLARFADAMPFEELIEAADLFLSENGILPIIPFKEEAFILANDTMYPIKITVRNPTTEIKRLLAFSRNEKS
jgi:tRNA1Val (adenine37-N6)-methyltransferase